MLFALYFFLQEKPVFIPEQSKEYKPREPMEFVRNVWGTFACFTLYFCLDLWDDFFRARYIHSSARNYELKLTQDKLKFAVVLVKILNCMSCMMSSKKKTG